MIKPRIRISTLSRCYVCAGGGVAGSGWTMREAFYSWQENKLIRGVQDLRKKYK